MIPNSPLLGFTLLIAHIYSLLLFTSIAPFVVTVRSSSVHMDGRAWYVLGGAKVEERLSILLQHFMVNLSVSWNANNPSYTRLPDGPATDMHSGALEASGAGWFVIVRGHSWHYSFKANSWSDNIPGGNNSIFSQGPASKGVADPETGLIYFPVG